jgi:preprotein translocase subunit YajC
MFQFLTETVGAANGTTPAGGGLEMIIMLAVMVGVFYFMLIRPENKRKKEAEATRNSVKVGDQVTTIGGIVGKVVHVKDDKFVMETSADQVRIEFAKWAISTNDTADAAAKEEAKKAQEAKAKARAEKKAQRQNKG